MGPTPLVRKRKEGIFIGLLGDMGLGSFRFSTWSTRLAVSVSLAMLLCPAHAVVRPAKHPVSRKPVSAVQPQPVQDDEEAPTIQLSAAKDRIHHEKPAKCEVWVDPERGFIDSCDAPHATAQGDNTLDVITLDKDGWLEAVPEDENAEGEPTEASAQSTAPDAELTALEALPQVITSWAEPILDIITLQHDSPSETAAQTVEAPPANAVEALVQPMVKAVESLAQVVLPQPAEKSPEPIVPPAEPVPVAEANPMAQPSQPLAPIVFVPEAPVQAPAAVAVEAPSVSVQPAPVTPPVVMLAVETKPVLESHPVTVNPPEVVKPAQTKPAKPEIQPQVDSSSPKPSWRYRNQPKEQYEWPKNPVSRVLKGVVALIHWIFN